MSDLLHRDAETKAAGKKNILHGAIWCTGGILFTLVTLAFSIALGEGTYIVASGAIIFGAIQLIRGAIQYFFIL